MKHWAFCLLLLAGDVSAAEPRCKIAVDVGHDKLDFGTQSARGLPEWQFNDQVGKLFYAELLRRHIRAMLYNADGRPVSLEDRPRWAAANGATLFVAIHHDSAQEKYMSQWQVDGVTHDYSDLFSGYGLFVSKKNPFFAESYQVADAVGGKLLAEGLHPSLHHAEPIPGENRPLLDDKKGIYQFDDLRVLKTATIPALLLEVGVLVNRQEELVVATPDYRNKVVTALMAGIQAHCDGR